MKAMIRLGPAGSPAASTLEGVGKVRELGLQAMEVEFVRGVRMSNELAKQVGKEAERLGISLSVHAPYYINLASEEKRKQEESKKRILDSCERGHHMGAKYIVFHPSYFGKNEKEKVYQKTKEHIMDMMRTIDKNKWDVFLAPETTGKHSALGSLDETLRLVKETGCKFTTDPAHLYARNYGKIDFGEVLDKLEKTGHNHFHFHFSGISFTAKGERNHEILDHNPDFRPFAREVLDRGLDVTVVSESPITWKDSLKMKAILEGMGHRF